MPAPWVWVRVQVRAAKQPENTDATQECAWWAPRDLSICASLKPSLSGPQFLSERRGWPRTVWSSQLRLNHTPLGKGARALLPAAGPGMGLRQSPGPNH